MTNIISNFYGRVRGSLNKHDLLLLQEVLPIYSIKEADIINIKGFKNIVLEIGFGSGCFTYNFAKKNKDTFILGVEIFQPGIASLLKKLNEEPLDNIKIYSNNFYKLLDNNSIPNNFFDSLYILFSDPWPKKRHNKRRIINNNNLSIFSKILKPNGNIYFATDDDSYKDWAYKCFLESDLFEICNNNTLNEPFPNYIPTKYEQKARSQGKDIMYIVSKNINKKY